jgi:CheY-like chemotaxis protein
MATILVVDDDPATRDVLCRYLQSIGYTVRCVANGRDALEDALANTPDLIVSDLMMPEMTGTSLIEVLRGYLRLQGIPFILWTGAGESLSLQRARDLNVNAVLIKPRATLEQIRQAIDSALSQTGSGTDAQ